MPTQIKSRKAKGRYLQQLICKKIAELYNIEYNQQDDNCLVHSREMGQSGTDVVLRGEIFEKFPFAIECKNHKKINLKESIIQARDNAKKVKKDWLLIHKNPNFKNPVAMLDIDVLLNLLGGK